MPSQAAQAKRILTTARTHLDQKRTEWARKYLRRVIDEYPTTPAAEEASRLLHELEPDEYAGSGVRRIRTSGDPPTGHPSRPVAVSGSSLTSASPKTVLEPASAAGGVAGRRRPRRCFIAAMSRALIRASALRSLKML